MSYTKREFIVAAYAEVGLTEESYDIQPEQMQRALRALDAMMATWNGKGVRLGYPLPSSPDDSDLDSESNVPDYANEAVVFNLAKRLAGPIGKIVSPDVKVMAKEAYKVLVTKSVMPQERQMPSGVPAGAGNKGLTSRRNVYLTPPKEQIDLGRDGVLDLE